MEFKEVQDEFIKIKQQEEITTINRIKFIFSRKISILDLSNHFIFQKSWALLQKSLKTYLKSKKPIKSLILQNCMMSAKIFASIIHTFKSYKQVLNRLDISNNRLELEPIHTETISLLFSMTSKHKSLSFKGNICKNSLIFHELFNYNICLKELNLYDTSLSPEALDTISKILYLNKTIIKINLGYNPQAFSNYVNVNNFACSISENSFIECLILSDNQTLGNHENLIQLCEGIKNNRSLLYLNISGLYLGDYGIKILAAHFLKQILLPGLNLQNNNITDSGLSTLMSQFPDTLTTLDISYNSFTSNSSLINLSDTLKQTTSLRTLNISHCFDLEDLTDAYVDEFCEAITKNDSMAEFYCEGIKIPRNLEDFCSKVNKAIEIRRLSLTYKISAITYNEKTSSDSIVSNDCSVKYLSKLPSRVWGHSSFTERKDYIDSPNQEPIINTSRQFSFSETFD
jgi:Ran GTPase-activating protein (RanGAP) involved in mRNA processing and transport